MNVLQLLQLVLALGNQLVTELKLKTDTPQDVITDAEAAIAMLQKVQGSDVTFGQLEGLRLQAAWPDPNAATGAGGATPPSGGSTPAA